MWFLCLTCSEPILDLLADLDLDQRRSLIHEHFLVCPTIVDLHIRRMEKEWV